jgi:hypothetical protein
MLSRIRYFVKKHIHYPVRDRVELIKTYSKIYKVTGRFIIYPSSVVFIFNKDRAFVETAFEDGNMAMEIVRFLGKLRRFNFSSLPLLPAGMLYRGIIWWREIPESINGWVEVDIKRAYPRVLYLVGAINSEDWKRAWLSKRISQAIIISLGMLQATRYELVFKDGELAQEYYGKKSYAYNRVVSQFSLDTFRLNEIAIARYVDAFLIREDDLSVFQEELRRAGYFGAVKGRLSKIEDLGGIVKFYITEVGGRYKAWSYSYEQILRVYNSIDEG